MEQSKYIYFSFQSSQDFEPTSKDLISFQRKYKKDFTSRELFENEELLDQYRLRGWKSPRYSKIVSIILAFEHEQELKVRFITGLEIDLFTELNNVLRKSQDYTLVDFESQIVLPYLGIRMLRSGFITPAHNGLKYRNSRPWDLKALDLQQYYDGAGNYKSSIKDIADDLGLNSNLIIEIEDEFTYYNTGDFEALKKSAIQKVEVMSQAHRILTELPPLQTVLIEEKVEDVQEEKFEVNLLKELHEANTITPTLKAKIKKLCIGKRLTKKDKENLFVILRGILVHCDFEHNDQDSKKVILDKEEQIRKLIEEI